MIAELPGLHAAAIARALADADMPLLFRASTPFQAFCADWSLQRLRQQHAGHAGTVRVVRGNRETGRTSFEQLPLSVFLEQLLGTPASPAALYLKEFPLSQLAAELPAQLNQQQYLTGQRYFSSAWIGGGATSTGTHFDIFDNLLFQVQGRKILRLAPPATVARANYSRKYDFCARIANIQLSVLENAHEVELQGGDMLYIPRGWWHQVENREPSFTISGFHAALPRLAWRGGAEYLRHALHCLNPLPRHCTCHAKS